MLPWTILISSGLEDLCTVTGHKWIFWTGVILQAAFIFYFEFRTTSYTITKAAMPLLATGAGLMPHVIRRIRFVFTILSLAAGIGGLLVFYWTLTSFR